MFPSPCLNPRRLAPGLALSMAILLVGCGGSSTPEPPPIPDTTPPTVVITDDTAGVAAGPVTFTFTFSEPISSAFTASQISVTNGTKGTFTWVDNTTGTLPVVPDTGSGTMTVSLAAGAFSDMSGNASLTASETTQDYNYTPPTKSAKRGIAYDLQTAADLNALKSGVSWWYNWGVGANAPAGATTTYGMDYIPMSWNGNNIAMGGAVDTYLTNHPDCKYLLVLNEPNLGGQANKTIAEVVAMWPQIEALAQKHGVKIVGPALTSGTVNTTANPSNPITWLDGFFAQYATAYGKQPQVDAIAFHWYDYGLVGSGNDFLDSASKLPKYGKKIWVTEFANWHYELNTNGTVNSSTIDTVAKQKEQMRQWVSWMETHDIVERYSWFTGRWADNSHFTSIFENRSLSAAQGDGVLSELGQYYINLPIGQ